MLAVTSVRERPAAIRVDLGAISAMRNKTDRRDARVHTQTFDPLQHADIP
jgi:hypothetical protein